MVGASDKLCNSAFTEIIKVKHGRGETSNDLSRPYSIYLISNVKTFLKNFLKHKISNFFENNEKRKKDQCHEPFSSEIHERYTTRMYIILSPNPLSLGNTWSRFCLSHHKFSTNWRVSFDL